MIGGEEHGKEGVVCKGGGNGMGSLLVSPAKNPQNGDGSWWHYGKKQSMIVGVGRYR